MMKNFLIILTLFSGFSSAFSQAEYKSKNRQYDIQLDTLSNGIWTLPDTADNKVIDSLFISYTGLPDYGDLIVPDLELMMKSAWYESKAFFLFRQLDDSLVNGYENGVSDPTIAAGLENRDAIALYFYLSETSEWMDSEDSIYITGDYVHSTAWIRYVWGTADFEGEKAGVDIGSLQDAGCEMVHWKDGNYRFSKLSLDFANLAPHLVQYDTTVVDTGSSPGTYITAKIIDSLTVGFAIELTETDKERELDGLFELQTRAYWANDYDSLPMEPRNMSRWGRLRFVYGDTLLYTPVKFATHDYARIYPNPAKEFVYVQLEKATEASYDLYDLTGRIVVNGTISNSFASIEVGDIRSGMYLLQIRQKGEYPLTKRILKL